MINLKEFKQSVLQKAMQGKLTRRLPSDGNAKNIIINFNQKKKDLISKKKIRNYRISPINNIEVPYNLPNSWLWVRLNEISIIQTGTTPSKRNEKNYDSKDVPFVTPTDLKGSYIYKSKRFISDYAYNKSRKALPNSIFVCGIGNVGKTGLATKVSTFNQQIHNINSFNIIVNKYILYWLQSNVARSQMKLSGTVVSIVNKTKFSNFLVPLPPLAEQQRIVSKIHKCFLLADTIQKERDLCKKFTHDMKQSLLLEAMKGHLTQQLPSDGNADDLLQSIQQKKQQLIRAGKIRKHKKLLPISKDEIPFKIPKNWKWVRIGTLCLDNFGGNTPSKHDSSNWDRNGTPWISVKDINNNYINDSEEHISKKGVTQAKMIPAYSFIVVVRMAIGEYSINTIPVAINQDLRALRIPKEVLNYFKYFYMTFHKRGRGATVKGITKTRLLNTLLPFPPLSEQHRIVSKLHDLFNTINA